MAKSKQKLLALHYRRKGMSIKEIAKKLHISVGSVSYWCKNVILTENQIQNLARRRTDPYYGKKRAYLENLKIKFNKKVVYLKTKGYKQIGTTTKRERFLIGLALYWAEGFKKDHQVGFSNTDPCMIEFFISWLKEEYNVKTNDLILRVTVNQTYEKKVSELEDFWAHRLGISKSQFSQAYIQKVKSKKQYENNADYHGVLRIKVKKSINLLRQIQGSIQAIYEAKNKT